MRRVLAVVLALCFAMSLVGCGGGGLKTGKYKLDSMTVNGQDYLALLKQAGVDVSEAGYLEIKDSKNAVMKTADGKEEKLTYDSKYFYDAVTGEKIGYSVSGSTITVSASNGGSTYSIVFKK